MWRIEIPRWHPTPLNKLLKAHWRERARLKRYDRDVVISHCLLENVPPATKKRRVSMTYIRGRGQVGPVPDVDALWKSLLDALVAASVICDDSHEWVEIAPVAFDRDKSSATIIELEDIE